MIHGVSYGQFQEPYHDFEIKCMWWPPRWVLHIQIFYILQM